MGFLYFPFAQREHRDIFYLKQLGWTCGRGSWEKDESLRLNPCRKLIQIYSPTMAVVYFISYPRKVVLDRGREDSGTPEMP